MKPVSVLLHDCGLARLSSRSPVVLIPIRLTKREPGNEGHGQFPVTHTYACFTAILAWIAPCIRDDRNEMVSKVIKKLEGQIVEQYPWPVRTTVDLIPLTEARGHREATHSNWAASFTQTLQRSGLKARGDMLILLLAWGKGRSLFLGDLAPFRCALA